MNTATCPTDHTHPSTENHTAVPTDGMPTKVFEEAFARCRPAIDALDAKDVLVPNLDIPTAVGTALRTSANVLGMRGAIAAAAPQFDLANIDRLADYAYAAGQAHIAYVNATQPPKDIVEVQSRAVVLRDTLYSDASALVVRGMLPPESLREFKAKVGYSATATDLMGLSSLLGDALPRVGAHTATSEHDLAEAQTLAAQLLLGVAGRNASPATIAQVASDRQRAFTLLAKAYDQVRRVVIFVRWDAGDADQLAPSLYANRNRGTRRKDGESTDGTEPAVTTPVSETQSASASPAEPARVDPASGLSNSREPGMPGSDPFVT